jgi:hypothetical protein
MDRAAWLAAFEAEMLELRPHLAPAYGSSKLLGAMAVLAYATREVDPVKAAREAHKRMGAPETTAPLGPGGIERRKGRRRAT